MKLFRTLAFFTLIFLNTADAQGKPCWFCREDVIQSQFVFATENYNILLDLTPRVPGHLLVIPKRHVATAHELTKEEWAELSIVISKVVQLFSKYLRTEEYVILEKNGRIGFQQIPHLHFHILPTTTQTWNEVFHDNPREPLTPEELEKECALLRSIFFSISP